MSMEQRGFTRGPWVLKDEEIDESGSYFEPYVATEDMALTVAIIRVGLEGTIANGHLIAAAPDLYRALKDLLEYLDDHEWGTIPSGGITDRSARGALAKAEGKSVDPR